MRCYKYNKLKTYTTILHGLPTNHFIIYPFFHNHIHIIMRGIGLARLVMAVSLKCNSIIEVAGHMENGNVTCMFSASVEDGDNFPII